MKKVLDKYGMCPSYYSYYSRIVFFICLLSLCAVPIPVFAQNNLPDIHQILVAQQTQPSKGGLWDMPNTPGLKSDTADLPSADSAAKKKMNEVQEKYRAELLKDCLPLPDNLIINDDIPYSVMQIIDQYKGEPCEMMNEIKFHLDEKRGKNAGQWAFEMIKIFKVPDGGDWWEAFAKKFATHAIPVAKIYSTLGDLKDAIEFIDNEIETNRLHGQYIEAVDKYRSSKGWNMTQFENETGSLYTDLKRKLRNVEKLESELYSECMKQYPSYDELRVYGPQFKPGTNIPNEAVIWQRYNEKIGPIEQKYEAEIVTNIREMAGIQLKIKFLENYRKPLIEKPCKEMMAELQKNCPKKTAETKTVTKPKEPGKKDPSAAPKTKEDLYWCLCKCSITIGVWGGYYPDPIPNSSPSCEKAGMCAKGNWGCLRYYPETKGDCFEQCIKNAGADKQNTIAEINKIKLDAFNDFIKEARGIIEEYIKFIPGVYRKKTLKREADENSDYIMIAENLSDKVSDGQVLYAAAAADVPMTYIEMIKEKNRRGDPDKALGLVKAAESILPDRKGELQNVLAEFAIIMSKASLNIVTDLEFDEGLYLLRKAAEFYKVGEASPLGENIKRLIKGFEKWKKDWQVLQQEIPNCLSLINKKQVCGCDKLYQAQIYPAAASLMIYEFASSEKWTIGTATGSPRAIPEKDKIFDEIKNKLASAKSQCEMNPILKTKEMKDLIDYETRKSLEQSPYINQDDLKKYSAPVICDTRAVKYAEKMLSTPDLCDCQQNKIKGILDRAKKYAEPIEADFKADAKEITFGQHVRLDFRIKGGKAPFMYEMSGDYPYNNKSEARGFTIQFQPKSSGANTFYATVVDSCGDSESKKVSVYVKPTPLSKTPEAPPPPATAKTAPPIQPPTTTRTQNPGYDPTKDPSYTTGKKPIDVAEADNLGKGFQEASIKTKKTEGQQVAQQPLTPVQEPTTKDPGSKKTTDSDTTYPPSPPYPPATGMTGTDWTKWGTGAPKPPTSSQSTTQPTTQPHTQSTGQPPTQPTTQPPATGGSTTTTPVDTRTVDCSATTKSGADAPATITVKVGQTKGTANFYYDMYTVKDRMIVQYAGQTLLDTGCISGSKTVPLNLSGVSDSVTVIVQPACEKKGTQWNFKLECPK